MFFSLWFKVVLFISLVFSLTFASALRADEMQTTTNLHMVVDVIDHEYLKNHTPGEVTIRFEEESDDIIEIGQHVSANETTDNRSLWKKIGRAELISLTGQTISMIFFFAVPTHVSHWPYKFGTHEFWKNLDDNYVNAFTKAPVFDKDDWYINFIAHPYSGALYYNAMRSQGATMLESFLFSFAQSTAWEYLIEASMERPSIQDLIVTPVLGSVLGELSHQATLKMRRRGFNVIEKIAVTIINPTYVLNYGYK